MFMYFSFVVVHLMWRIGFDPDYNAIPLLTSTVDFFGSYLLLLVFHLLNEFSPHSLTSPALNTTELNSTVINQ